MKTDKQQLQNWLELEEKEQMIEESFNNIINVYKASDKIIDLHTHTYYSDGDLSPMELIKLAIEKKVGIIGITDHDTLEGIKNINKLDPLIVNSGIKIIDGIELSTKVKKGTMHILGYNIDINDISLNQKTLELKNNSMNSFLSIIEQIKKDFGIFFDDDDINEIINSNHNLGRPHIAKLCIKYGYASSVQDAFDKYLISAHKKTKSTRKDLQYNECIELILKSNGIPVLAHPKSLEISKTEFLKLIKEMINCGLKGIEIYHSSHTEEEMKFYLEIANKYNLLVSGGSDYHGLTVKPDIDLGTGKNNNLKIKSLSLVNHIKNKSV